MEIKEKSIVAVDLDGTLCEGECFTEEDCLKTKPKIEMINKVNELNRKKDCFIIIYTSRKEFLRNATTFWLKWTEVRYQALVMEKLWADVYIDDKNVLIKDLMKDRR